MVFDKAIVNVVDCLKTRRFNISTEILTSVSVLSVFEFEHQYDFITNEARIYLKNRLRINDLKHTCRCCERG